MLYCYLHPQLLVLPIVPEGYCTRPGRNKLLQTLNPINYQISPRGSLKLCKFWGFPPQHQHPSLLMVSQTLRPALQACCLYIHPDISILQHQHPSVQQGEAKCCRFAAYAHPFMHAANFEQTTKQSRATSELNDSGGADDFSMLFASCLSAIISAPPTG